MTWPSHCNSAFSAPLTMLSSGRLHKTTSLENLLDLTCFPFPPCTDWLCLPPPLQGSWPRPRAAGCQFILPSNWGGALAFLRWNICHNSSRGVREFTDWQGTKEFRRTPDAVVALAIPEDNDATIPEEPKDEAEEDEGVTPEDEAEFTACLKSGCLIICLTRLSKLSGVEPRFAFAISCLNLQRDSRGWPFKACVTLPLHWRETQRQTQQAQAEAASYLFSQPFIFSQEYADRKYSCFVVTVN